MSNQDNTKGATLLGRWARASAKKTLGVPSVVALGASAMLGVLLHSWAIGGVGVLASCAFVAVDLAQARSRRAGLPPSGLDAPDRLADPQTSFAVRAILAARRELERTLDDTPASLAAELAPALAQTADLDARAAKLSRRAEEIAAYVGKTDIAGLRREVDALAARIAQTSDDTARAHYAAAQSARTDQLATLRELSWAKERIGASLLAIAATLDALTAKIVRLRGLDGAASDVTHDVHRDLATMNEELASFEDTLLQVSES